MIIKLDERNGIKIATFASLSRFTLAVTEEVKNELKPVFTTVQRNYPIGSVDLNRNHSSDVLV